MLVSDMKRKKPNGSQTMHLKLSRTALDLLRQLASDERRTMHNLAVVVLEQGLRARAAFSSSLASMKGK